MSQQDLADRAGLNIGGITKLEQGQREPSWPTVLALAEALGVTPNDFRLADEPAAKDEGKAGKRKPKVKE